jgi:hypothetical protein
MSLTTPSIFCDHPGHYPLEAEIHIFGQDMARVKMKVLRTPYQDPNHDGSITLVNTWFVAGLGK